MSTHLELATLRDLDALPAAERAEALEHVRTCRVCRATLVAQRPEALFGLLARRPLPQEALDRLSRNVTVAIDDLEAPARPAASSRRWAVVGALAASLLLAFVLGWPLLRQEPPTQIADASAPPTAPAAPAAAAVDSGARLPVRGIELLSSPGEAEVVDFAIGDAQVVMIFDKEFDI